MAARVIDLSRLSEKQLCELGRHIGRNRHGAGKPEFRHEPADENLFVPLAKAIAKEECGIDRVEEKFRATKFRNFEHIRGSGYRGHLSYYLGFLFETAVQLSILRFSQENPELLTVLRERSGELSGGRHYSVDSRGSAVFHRPVDNGRTLQTIAEIDMVGELHEGCDVFPVIFEITLMNDRRKDFNIRRKSELIEEIYGRKPYFCVISPAYEEEVPGVTLQFSVDRGAWRDMRVPRNDGIRALASRLFDEEHAAKENGKQASSCGA